MLLATWILTGGRGNPLLGLDDDDLGEVVAADTGGEEARYATQDSPDEFN